MNKQLIKSYIEEYKNQFEFVNQQEIYKWKAVKQFQDNWDIDATDFHAMLDDSLKIVSNLLDSGQYYPKRMLLANTEVNPEETRQLFKDLFNEELDIFQRIKSFRSSFKRLNESNFTDLKDYQDHRAVIVYLALRFPERYFFYKYRMFKSFSEIINYSYKPVAGKIKNIGHFQTLCRLLKHELSKDQELLKLHKNRLSDDCYFDENLNILTQDFVYAVVRHLDFKEVVISTELGDVIQTEVNTSEIAVAEGSIDFTPKTVNFIENNKENKRIGDLGELWVVEQEKWKLRRSNRSKLADKVKHVAKNKGDGLGYDILSYDLNGNELYIEVKTTKGIANSTFYITRNELEKSKIEKDNYRIYRVFKFDEVNSKAELLIIKGDMTSLCKVPLTYKVKISAYGK